MGRQGRTPSHLVNEDDVLTTQQTSASYIASLIRNLERKFGGCSKKVKNHGTSVGVIPWLVGYLPCMSILLPPIPSILYGLAAFQELILSTETGITPKHCQN